MDTSWKKLSRDQEFFDISDYARPAALLVTRFLVKTPITSIQVTFLFLLAGLSAAIFLCLGTYGGAVIAALFIQLKNMLDAVDGSLARAKQTQSPVGRYLDSVFDFVVNVALYGAIVIYLVKTTSLVGLPFIGLLGFLVFLSAMLQCSLFNYYSVAYRKFRTGSDMSRLDESAPLSSLRAESQSTRRKLIIHNKGIDPRSSRG